MSTLLLIEYIHFYGYENKVWIIKSLVKWVYEAAVTNRRGERAAECSSSKAGLCLSTNEKARCAKPALSTSSPKQAYAQIKLEKNKCDR